MTMHLAKLRLLLAALVAAPLALGLPSTAAAQDEDEDGDNVLESDEVSGDEEYEEDDGEGGTTTIVIKDTDPSAVVVFRDKLAPYGSWMEHPTYGTIWVPSSALVGSDFAPYVSSGRWELTEEGDWLWVSDYEWGYIPFHYGRWVWVSGVGWGWIPGRVYAPAWVVWRTGESGYIGWAPMPPGYYWVDGVAVTLWMTPPAAYVFCHHDHFWHRHVHHHVIHDHAEVRRAAQATTAYTPAKPTKAHTPAQPTLKEAGVDRPKAYGKHDPKATRFMRPDGSAPKSSLANKGSSPRAGGTSKRGDGSAASIGRGSSAGARQRGSRSLGTTDDGFVTKRSGRGSFSASDPQPKTRGSKSLGGSRAGSDASAPSRSDGASSRPSKSGKPSKSNRSSSSSSDDRSSRSSPPSRSSDDRSSHSSPPSRSDSPSFGSSRPSSPSISRPPSGGSAPSTKRAAPKPVPKAPSRAPSRGGRGRR